MKIRLFILFYCLTLSSASFGSTGKTNFNIFFNKADFVGIVSIDSYHKVDENCGYLVNGTVVKSFKGDESKISFFSSKLIELDFKAETYFIMTFRSKNKDKAINTCRGLSKVSSNYQTFFPFYNGPYGYREKQLLVNRSSFLTASDGVSYVVDSHIDGFISLGSRIYASANWVIIEKDIKAILSAE